MDVILAGIVALVAMVAVMLVADSATVNRWLPIGVAGVGWVVQWVASRLWVQRLGNVLVMAGAVGWFAGVFV